jgi:hypothetical protein
MGPQDLYAPWPGIGETVVQTIMGRAGGSLAKIAQRIFGTETIPLMELTAFLTLMGNIEDIRAGLGLSTSLAFSNLIRIGS